jgi:hypothetical protein
MSKIRTSKGWTQNQLALQLQLFGWDTRRESVTRLENQSRRVPDLELFVVAKILASKPMTCFRETCAAKLRNWPRFTASNFYTASFRLRHKIQGGFLPAGENIFHLNAA